jgi:50S ribosomal protein L16 3-hydroxylase
MKFKLNKRLFLKNFWEKKAIFIPKGISNFEDNFVFSDFFNYAIKNNLDHKVYIKEKNQYRQQLTSKSISKKSIFAHLFFKTNHFHQLSYELLNLITFIPDYLIDDVLISHSSLNGSVGKHQDNYSVFLIQGKGCKEWRIYQDNKILKFMAHEGDVLYVPPNVFHYGISKTDICNTYSIGFRSPDTLTIQEDFNNFIFEKLNSEKTNFFKSKNFSNIKSLLPLDILKFFQNHLDYKSLIYSDFIGHCLTTVDLNLFSKKSMPKDKFIARCRENPIYVDQRSRVCFYDDHFFINGEKINIHGQSQVMMKKFFNEKEFRFINTTSVNIEILHKLYLKSYLTFKRMFNF